MNNKIDDLKLEIISLQKKDELDAKNKDINDKKKWVQYNLVQDNDEIAQALIEISKRYNIPIENISTLFDESVYIRVVKQLQRNKKPLKNIS